MIFPLQNMLEYRPTTRKSVDYLDTRRQNMQADICICQQKSNHAQEVKVAKKWWNALETNSLE